MPCERLRKLLLCVCEFYSWSNWGMAFRGVCPVGTQAWIDSPHVTVQLVSPHLFTELGCYLDTVYGTFHHSGRNFKVICGY